jgi:transposase, IS5 family
MKKYNSTSQMIIPGFESELHIELMANNRWVQLSSIVPWDDLVKGYMNSLVLGDGADGINPRIAVGSIIIKHKLNISDRELVSVIQENPYMQYFLGLNSFDPMPLFHPSLMVSFRKRMTNEAFDKINKLIIKDSKQFDLKLDGERTKKARQNWGTLMLDATVADQYIKFPTDLDLLNESRQWSEEIIDTIFPSTTFFLKPRTYRRLARKHYLNIAKKKNKTLKEIRKGIRYQLNCLRRNFQSIDRMLDSIEYKHFPLSKKQQRYLWVIKEVYRQQKYMYDNKVNSVEDRIVSLHQPHVRPIVRGKAKNKVEFGSKLSVSLTNGFVRIDRLGWDAFNESGDLKTQVEAYKEIHGYWPEVVIIDAIYATRENRNWLKERNIRITAKELGRPIQKTRYQKEKEKKEKCSRNQIEGKFGQAKNGNSLNKIRARLKTTSESWIGAIFLVMNLQRFFEQTFT